MNDRGQNLEWDAEGHLAKVSEPDGNGGTKTSSYLYDTDGNRLIQRTATETTLYLGNSEITLAKGATKAKATRYYDLGTGIQAVRSDDDKISFTVPDHQGTGQLAVDAATLALQQRRTTPFGSVRGTQPLSWPGTKGFVGGAQDTTDLRSRCRTDHGTCRSNKVPGRVILRWCGHEGGASW